MSDDRQYYQAKNIKQIDIKLLPYQDKFLFSSKRYCAMISAIGTGKTFMALLKVWRFCQDYPGSRWLTIRKEYTDLRDSTMKDFELYFGVKINKQSKSYTTPNGSEILFRHGEEISPNVLKNMNLSGFFIEQAEEFRTEQTFVWLQDRLRKSGSPYRQGLIIANSDGHNWCWRLFIHNPPSDDYMCVEATTFDNEVNLPADFIKDMRLKEIIAPNHYKRMVMNQHDIQDEGDLLLTNEMVERAMGLRLTREDGYIEEGGVTLGACDVARFGDDLTVFMVIQRVTGGWKQIFIDSYQGKDLMQTVGHIIDIKSRFKTLYFTLDDVGLGGGVTDRLIEQGIKGIVPFAGNTTPDIIKKTKNKDLKMYAFDILEKLVSNNELQIKYNEEQATELGYIKYKFHSSGKRMMVSKDDMKKLGYKSPNFADCLSMCVLKTVNITAVNYAVRREQLRTHGRPKPNMQHML